MTKAIKTMPVEEMPDLMRSVKVFDPKLFEMKVAQDAFEEFFKKYKTGQIKDVLVFDIGRRGELHGVFARADCLFVTEENEIYANIKFITGINAGDMIKELVWLKYKNYGKIPKFSIYGKQEIENGVVIKMEIEGIECTGWEQ